MQAKLFYGSLVAFVFGIGVMSVWRLSLATTVWVMFVALVLAILWRRFRMGTLLLSSVVLASCVLGIIRMEMAQSHFGHSPLEAVVQEKVSLSGVVVSEPEERERTKQFFLQVQEDKLLVSTDRLSAVSYGEVVTVHGVLKKPESFTTDLGRVFDYSGYLKARGVEYQISFAEVEVTDSGKGNPFMRLLFLVKQQFITSLQNIIPEPAVSLGKGLLLGVKSALGEDIEQDFRRTGIIHIVVLSGYNVMLVVAFILFCFSYVLSLRWRLLFGIVTIVAFALLVGLSATVVRASMMASLLLIAQLMGRQYHVLRALCFAAVMMLLLNPYLLLFDVGFQLSFMATLGLVLLLPQFEATLLDKGVNVGWRSFLYSTVATQLAVLPLLLYHIGEVSLIALVVNMLVLPMVPLAMLLTFLTGVTGLILPTLAGVVGYGALFSLQYILVIAEQFAMLPFAVVQVGMFPAWGVFVLYGIFAGLWLYVQHKNIKRTGLLGEKGEMQNDLVKHKKNEDGALPVFFR